MPSTEPKPFSGRVIFDHQPRTAGQAVSAWLRRELGNGSITPVLLGDHQELIRYQGGRYPIISAHVQFANAEGLDPRYQYMTCLRNPVDRIISWLNFVVTSHSAAQLPELFPMAKRFLDSGGRDLPKNLVSFISNRYVHHFSRILGTGMEPDEVVLDNSIAAINLYDVVGIFENLRGFVSAAADLLHLVPPESFDPPDPKHKPYDVRPVPAALRDAISGLNHLDLQFYDKARGLSESRAHHSLHNAPSVPPCPWTKHNPVYDRVLTDPGLTVHNARIKDGARVKEGSLMSFEIDASLHEDCTDFEMGIRIHDSVGKLAFGINNNLLNLTRAIALKGHYRISHHLVAKLLAGKYTAGFTFAAKTGGILKELYYRDEQLHFEITPSTSLPHAGYSYLTACMSMVEAPPDDGVIIVADASGYVKLDGDIIGVKSSTPFTVKVQVCNTSGAAWKGDELHPINLSYHWLDSSGNIVHFEGRRSVLPADTIEPHKVLSSEMIVEPPPSPGIYKLFLTLVQDRVAWLESRGLKTCEVAVVVRD